MKRNFNPAEPELMDRPQPVSAELERDLANLRQLNRFFGSYRLIRYFLRRWIKPGQSWHVLDLATGSGDIPRLIVDYARSIRAAIGVDAVDQQSSTLEIARRLSASYPEIAYHAGDIRQWHSDTPYDIVLCSLALHHFSENDVTQVLHRCHELSERFVLISDLARGRFVSVGVYLLTTAIFREPMTRHDGRISAARAFSFREMGELARRAGWQNFGHAKFVFGRQAIWLEKTH